MKQIGRIENISNNSLVVVKTISVLNIGTKVFDNKNNAIGIVRETIGSVKEPYLIIRITSNKVSQTDLIGKEIYTR
jgi:rRNA processing protein Gar1